MIKLTIDIISDDFQFNSLHMVEHRFAQMPREGDYLMFPEGCMCVESVVFMQDGVCFEPQYVRVFYIPPDKMPKPRGNVMSEQPLARAERINPEDPNSPMRIVVDGQAPINHITEVMP